MLRIVTLIFSSTLLLGKNSIRHTYLQSLFLLTLLLGWVGELRAIASVEDELRVERIGAFSADTLETKYGFVRFEQGNGRYGFDLGAEKWYLGSVKMAIDEGAELWEVFSDGREILRGVYDTELKRFVKVVNL